MTKEVPGRAYVEYDGILGQVVGNDGERVALAEAAAKEPRAEGLHARAYFGKGQPAAGDAVDEGSLVWVDLRRALQHELVERHVGYLHRPVRAPEDVHAAPCNANVRGGAAAVMVVLVHSRDITPSTVRPRVSTWKSTPWSDCRGLLHTVAKTKSKDCFVNFFLFRKLVSPSS